MKEKIKFKHNDKTYETTKYDKKNNLLYVNVLDNNGKTVSKEKLKTGLLPKKIKQLLNPL